MSLVHNERSKLTANWLNSISAAFIAVGAFAQLASLFSGSVVIDSSATGLFSVIWLALGVTLHAVARLVLGSLRE